MKLQTKIFALIAILVIAVIATPSIEIYNLFVKPDPHIDNLIGMTRTEVVNWLDKNGRVHSLYEENDKTNGKIYLAFDHAHDTFNSKEEILQNQFVMDQDEWELGFKSVCRGRIFSSVIRFKDNIVISQHNASNTDF